MVCLGIAQRPLKCEKCEVVYCTACIFPKVQKHNQDYECFQKCGCSKLVSLSKIEKNILSSLKFKCTENFCSKIFSYDNFKNHKTKECSKLAFLDYAEELRLDQIFKNVKNGIHVP